MNSPAFQFSKDDFERLAWDARLDPYAKLVALAIRHHMNHKTLSANPGIGRLAKMCGIADVRTVRRCISDISRVLGVEVIPKGGSSHTYLLKVFQTADEIAAMLEQEEWRKSHWLLLNRDELEISVRAGGVISGAFSGGFPVDSGSGAKVVTAAGG